MPAVILIFSLSALIAYISFANTAKQAETTDYVAYNETIDSSLMADGAILYDLSVGNNLITKPSACGEPIYASLSGIVEEAGEPSHWNDGFGGYVKVKHLDKNIVTIYAHTSSNEVKVGDIVRKGGVIAKVGMTGNSDICNLQFGVINLP